MPSVETSTPPITPEPIGPYSHVAKVGNMITIGATAGVNPATGQLAGSDIRSQTAQIFDSFSVMLESVGSDLAHLGTLRLRKPRSTTPPRSWTRDYPSRVAVAP
jgi:enamine deaminase RidA (YjgF/YER057c/UK114 family)